jgi:hypothetical protein
VRNDFSSEAAGQQPQELPVMALHWFLGTPKATSELSRAEMRCEVDGSRHAPLCTTLCRDRELLMTEQ